MGDRELSSDVKRPCKFVAEVGRDAARFAAGVSDDKEYVGLGGGNDSDPEFADCREFLPNGGGIAS